MNPNIETHTTMEDEQAWVECEARLHLFLHYKKKI